MTVYAGPYCVWREEDDNGNLFGPACGQRAAFWSCQPGVRSPTCEQHKCRCARPIRDESAPQGLRASKPACPSDAPLYDERMARLVRAAQIVAKQLPNGHVGRCAVNADRECGVCDCGAEEAGELRKAVADMIQQTERWGVLLLRTQPSGAKSQQWFFEGYPHTPWSGTREQAQRKAAQWNADKKTGYYTACAKPMTTGASGIPQELG